MAKTYLDFEDFDIKSSTNTGGVTGSKRVTKAEIHYQLKPSIKNAPLIRNIKAGDTDRENYGEVIAAEVSRILTNSEVEIVPKVSLVYDKDHKQTLVASRYLNKVVGTLDEFAKERGVVIQNRHAVISTQTPSAKGTLNLEDEKDNLLKKDLSRAIAISALTGDHDVNPGNMMVILDPQGHNRLARIDFGHAFNDLLNAPPAFGGGLINKNNRILDFFNRKEVANLMPSNRGSKLWKSYIGVVPSAELVDSLHELAGSDRLIEGINNAKQPFQELINELQQDPKGNKAVLDHIRNSLIAINNNISDKKILVNTSVQETLDKTFENLQEFYDQGLEQMRDVAKLMDMQLKIDKLIETKKNTGKIDKDLVEKIKDAYNKLEKNPTIIAGQNAPGIVWVKNSKNTVAFTGTLEKFVEHRTIALLGVKSQAIIDSLEEQTVQKKLAHLNANLAAEATLISTFLAKSVEFYIKEKNDEHKQLIDNDTVKDNTKLALANFLNQLGAETSEPITEIIATLKENLPSYVDNMDKKLTKARDNLLKEQNITEATPSDLEKVMQQISASNPFAAFSKNLRDAKSIDSVSENTIWNNLAKMFAQIGLSKLAKFCEERHKQTTLQSRAKEITSKVKINPLSVDASYVKVNLIKQKISRGEHGH